MRTPLRDTTLGNCPWFRAAGMLVGALISVPFWGMLAKKIRSNQKALMIAACVVIVSLIPTAISTEYWQYTLSITFFGVGFGGYWFLITPVMADVIDEIVVKTKKREDGIYMGFRAFFGRLAYGVQAISFTIVHYLTRYQPKVDGVKIEQTALAKLGIRIHLAVLPMIFMIIGLIIFWRMNTLTPEKMETIHAELEELNL